MKRLCIDTSVINRLADDPKSDLLVERIRSRFATLVTAVNIIEALRTKTPERRERLRLVMCRLAGPVRPLALPHQLLYETADAFQTGRPFIDASLPIQHNSLYRALTQPNVVLDENFERWPLEADLETDFPETALRIALQMFGDASEMTERRRISLVVRRLAYGHLDLLYRVPEVMFQTVMKRPFHRADTRRLMDTADGVWATYLAGRAVGMYFNTFWQPEWRPRNTAGALDLWAATYLPTCDVFVTHDTKHGGQYEGLRIANVFNRRKPRTHVQKWINFRRELDSIDP